VTVGFGFVVVDALSFPGERQDGRLEVLREDVVPIVRQLVAQLDREGRAAVMAAIVHEDLEARARSIGESAARVGGPVAMVVELTEEQVERIRQGERDPLKLGLFEGRAGAFVGTATVTSQDGRVRRASDEMQPGDRIVVDDEIPFGADDEGGAL
jgi:hypothetical protein